MEFFLIDLTWENLKSAAFCTTTTPILFSFTFNTYKSKKHYSKSVTFLFVTLSEENILDYIGALYSLH